MSGTLSLQLPGNRREVVKTTPTTTLGAVLAEACARGPRPLGDPASYLLMQGKATLDLSLSLRFAGVASGARLEVVKKQALGAPCAVEPPAAVPAAATSKRVHPATHDAPEVGAQPQVPPEEVRGCVAEPTACAMAPGCAPAAPHGADDAAVHAAQALAARRQAACALAGRAVRVYSRDALLAAGQQPPEELPEAFYEFTPEDYHVVTRRKEEEVLMTKSMREAAVAKRASEFSRALVRVEFPDGLVLEAAFSPLEPLQALRALVCACVEPSLAAAVYLFTAPPKQKMARWELSFYAAGLVPAARVHCGLEGLYAKAWPLGQPMLREELRALTDAVAPQLPAQVAGGGGAVADQPAPGGAAAGPSGEAPPREGVFPPGEIRSKLAAGGKPKWLKL